MKIKVWASVLVFALLVCSGHLSAKERRGAEVVVQKRDGWAIEGELIAVKPSSLVLLEAEMGADLSIEMGEVAVIKIIRKPDALTFGAIAFGLGTISCICLYAAGEYGLSVSDIAASYFFGAGVAIPGYLIGMITGKDKTYQIEGKSESEIQEILKKLRRQARIANAL